MFAQINAFPVTDDGCAGGPPGTSVLVRAIEVPQEEEALTEIVPAVEPGVINIELPVDVPLHPEGSVQV